MKTAQLQAIRKEYKAYGKKEVMFDVYQDRVNFIGSDFFPLRVYCDNRNIIFDRDRAGYSISIPDAEKLGIPTEIGTYIIGCRDLRKAEFVKR